MSTQSVTELIVCGIASRATRAPKKMLQTADPHLAKCINTCESVEVAAVQIKGMSDQSANIDNAVTDNQNQIVTQLSGQMVVGIL